MLLNIMIQDLLRYSYVTEHHDTGLVEVAMILDIMIEDLLR